MVRIPPRLDKSRFDSHPWTDRGGVLDGFDLWGGMPDERRPARCRDKRARSLLMRYALSHCSEGEEFEFEAHMLGCESCFEGLKALDRTRVLVREFTGAPSPVLDRVRRSLTRRRRVARWAVATLLFASFAAGLLLGLSI